MNLENLSKIVSHALRHAPEKYNLNIDENGWVSLFELENGLVKENIITNSKEIIEMVNQSSKKRHEIVGDKIRACYGHSLPGRIFRESILPPEFLYHGTVTSNIDSIQKEGILPMQRQFVHLSSNIDEAKLIAMRRKGEIVIIKVKAYNAHEDGVNFYKEKNEVWLSDKISAQFIEILDDF